VVFQNKLLMGAGGQPTGYEIDYSCRFDSDTPAYLARTFGTPTSDKIWTFSLWVKICKRDSGSVSIFMGAGDYNADYTAFLVTPDFKWDDRDHSGAAWKTQLRTNAVYRDPSAWYHIVYSYDSTPSTPSASSIKMFVNGEQLTSFSSETYPSQNTASVINTAVANWIGGVPTNGATYYFDGYMAEVVFVDGTALDADSFGETNSTTGQWIPKAISGLTFGNNGFHLDFADSSSLGNDVSGNNNDFTSSGLAAADQVTDSPTDNYNTLNSLDVYSGTGPITVSNGNLFADKTDAGEVWAGVRSTQYVNSSGKWYFENKLTNSDISGVYIGLSSPAQDLAGTPSESSTAWVLYPNNGNKNGGGSGQATYMASASQNDIIQIAYDAAEGDLWFGKNNQWADGSGNNNQTFANSTAAFTDISGDVCPTLWLAEIDSNVNFGQLGFAYTPPTDYTAFSTANLDDPTIADPSAYFQPTLYTGDGASSLAVNQGGNSTFSPDFVWIKNRDAVSNNLLFDAVRGATKWIPSNDGDVEETEADTLLSFDSDGFSVGDSVRVNTDTEKYVGWQWLEDATPGFDIVSFTGNGSNRTISHSLSAVPELIILKNLDTIIDWSVYTAMTGNTHYLTLNSTAISNDNDEYWNDTTPTSSVFTVGTHNSVNKSSSPMIAYLWAGVEGYSKFGSYTGNGNADGPFVWCGFRPSTILLKRTDAINDWTIKDSTRNPYNVVDHALIPDATNAEYTATWVYVDFLSNGFKVRSTDNSQNTSGGTYVFMAFADTPFKTALAR